MALVGLRGGELAFDTELDGGDGAGDLGGRIEIALVDDGDGSAFGVGLVGPGDLLAFDSTGDFDVASGNAAGAGTGVHLAMRLLVLLIASGLATQAQSTNVATLLTKDIPEFQGKEVTMLTVTYAPGQVANAHRHHAHVFVYVLEGTVVMQVAGGVAQELGPGGTFYEKPSDIHAVAKNGSATKPAKILVMMLKDKDKPVSEPVRH